MPTAEQLICPQCQGLLAAVFTGKRCKFICPKCDKAPDLLSTPEVQCRGLTKIVVNDPAGHDAVRSLVSLARGMRYRN